MAKRTREVSRSSADIKRDIARTRADIDRTAAAVQKKLTPETLIADAKGAMLKKVSPRNQRESLYVQAGEAAGAVMGKVIERTVEKQLKKPRVRRSIKQVKKTVRAITRTGAPRKRTRTGKKPVRKTSSKRR